VEELAKRAAAALGSDPQAVVAALVARESLGSTGLGQGFALPHARLAGLGRFFGLFARLVRPIEFQAIDERPIDLIFLLLIPEQPGSEHVAALAAIARRMRDQAFARRLRKVNGASAMYDLLTNAEVR
jgi:nitrogen PTS system EIIA component